jgi:predicted acylesterase/phospholipase RssA
VTRPRVGLALSGGGPKGAFTVGALNAVRDRLAASKFEAVSGTSTGALIATCVAAKRWALLDEIYSNTRTEDIVVPEAEKTAFFLDLLGLDGPRGALLAAVIQGRRNAFDTRPLLELIRRHADFDWIRSVASETFLSFSTVDLQSGAIEAFNNRDHSAGQLQLALLASANQPVLTPPVAIPGRTHQFVDGGVREYLPLLPLLESGVDLDLVIAVANSPLSPRAIAGAYDGVLDILGRTIDLFSTDVGASDLSEARLKNALARVLANADAAGYSREPLLKDVDEEVTRAVDGRRPVRILLIDPPNHLEDDPGISGLEFDPAKMRRAMEMGRARAVSILDREGIQTPADDE